MKLDKWNLAGVAAFVAMFGSGLAVYGAEDYSQWSNACNITLNTSGTGANVTTAQTGFPVLVRLTSATAAFSFGQAMTAGQDIRFSKSDGTHIPYQIERFDQGNQLAEIWVKVDVNGNDAAQYITMYWGKPGSADSSNGPAVFGAANGFLAAMHLNETGNSNPGGYANATPVGNGTGSGMVAGDEANCIIARGQNFNTLPLTADAALGQPIVTIAPVNTARFAVGQQVAISIPGGNSEYNTIQSINGGTGAITLTNNLVNLYTVAAGSFMARYIRIPSGINLNATDFSMSGWVKVNVLNGQQYFMSCASAGGNPRYSLGANGTNFYCTKYTDGSIQSPADLNWHYVVATWTNATFLQTLYVDGVSVGTHTSTSGSAINGELTMGWRQTPNSYGWNGSVDEVCVANVSRSADWINLCYQSQKPTANWLTFTSVTLSAPTITTNPSNTTVNSGQTATFNVVASGGGLSYQWERSPDGLTWSNAPGTSTAPSYSFTTVYPGDNGAQFRCHVHNSIGDAYSNAATLTVTCNPPTIGTQPLPQSVTAGQNAVFSVAATGATGYQWQRSPDGTTWPNAPGASTSSTYSFATAYPADNGVQFRCQVSNVCGSINSSAATLTVTCNPPTINTQPLPQSVTAGQNAVFSVAATGAAGYQWQRSNNSGVSWANVTTGTGGTTNSYTLSTVAGDSGAQFHCVVSNGCGSVNSSAVLLSVLTVCTPPGFSQQPSPWAGIAGSPDTFAVQLIAGVTSPVYQWQRNDIPTPGTWGNVPAGNGSGTTATYISTAQAADNGVQFRCYVTGACGTPVTSNAVTASVCSPPTITANPKDSNVTAGAPVSFTVVAGGGGAYAYQWQSSPDGIAFGNITGATLQMLSFPSADPSQNGYRYRCQVTNGCGTNPAVSSAAGLTVCSPPQIISQPGNADINIGDTASLTVSAQGTAPAYQWQRGPGWSNITGATSTTYKFVPVASDNGATFRVQVSGCGTTVTSGTVSLAVCTPPVISRQPQSLEVTAGSNASFTLHASGTNLTYQWQRISSGPTPVTTDIAGATDTLYTRMAADSDNGAKFQCNITSKCGTIPTSAAVLTVCDPVKVTQQNIGPDSVLVGQTVRFGMTAQGTNVTFQWQKSNDGTTFRDTAGATADTFSFVAALSDSGVTFRCIVSGRCGTQVTGNPGLVRVFTPVHAAFSASPAAGLVPLVAAFADSSTGSFTKRVWNFGDGTADSILTANKTLSHSFTVAKNYTVKLTVSGPGGTDSVSKQIFVYVLGADPIQMSGSYVTSQKVSVVFSNFDTIITPSAQVTVDSVGVWYKAGLLPQTPALSTYLRTYAVATLRSRGTSTYTDTLAVPVIAAPDSVYGLMNGIFWSDGKISTFDSGNGTLVLMKDTFPITNNLQISGRYAPDDTALVFLDFANKIDTSRVDSVLLWYSLTGDTNPNFTDKNFTSRLGAKTVAHAGASDTIPIVNELFNNELRTICAAVVLVGHNTKLSDVKKWSFAVGKKRPINPIHLRARALSSKDIKLAWKSVAGSGVERIVIWYRTGSPIPLQYDFSSLMLDSLVPSVADTSIASSKFNPRTRYYFGAQVYENGLWSYVTDSSSASDSTWATGAPLSKNNTAVTSLVFDTSVNQIKVCWKADSTVLANGDSLPQLAIVYSTDSFATAVGGSAQIVDIKGASDCAYVKLREDLVFNATYYVSLWLRASNSAWTAPSTVQGRQSVAVPMYKWQSVLLFSKDYDTVYAFNRQLRFTNQPGDLSRVPDTAVADSIRPYGFTPVSIAFEFKVKDAGWPFYVGLKLSPIPAGYTAKDVRIFRPMPNGEWMVDTLPVYVDSLGGYAYELTNQLAMPFVAGVDMTRPSVRILTNVTDSVPAGVAITDTFLLSDNIANLKWRFMSTKGGEAFATGDTTQSGMLSDTSQRIAVTIPFRLVSPDNGVRERLIVTDLTYTDTVDVSRRVVRDSSDLVWTENGKWVPMSVTVDLDTSSAIAAFLPLSGTPWKYDKTKFRVFRWGAAAADKWVEYADTISSAFAFVRGSQMWVKAKTKTPIRFGRGVTPSLGKPFMVTLPSKQWVDLALPFKFDITVADIVGATRDSAKTGDTLGIDSILIFDWAKDTTGHYRTELIFNNTIISPQLNNAAQPLSSSGPGGFSFYNKGGGAVQLVIPPIPQAMSTRLAKKAAQKQQQGWAIKVTSVLGDGSMLSTVYCGYSKTASAATTYYPVSPTFGDASLGVFDRATRRVFGHAMAHAAPEGGCAFLLAFCNDGKDRQKISCSLANLSLLPKGTEAALYDDATGAFENLTGGSAGVSVDGGSKGFRWLLVGPKEYLAKASIIARPAVLKLFGTYPNPFRSMVRIRYSLPYDGIDRVTFSIYDIRGRTVWRTEVSGVSTSGVNDVLWNGRSEDGRPVAAGMYILRMTAFNTDRKPCGAFDRKMTFMP